MSVSALSLTRLRSNCPQRVAMTSTGVACVLPPKTPPFPVHKWLARPSLHSLHSSATRQLTHDRHLLVVLVVRAVLRAVMALLTWPEPHCPQRSTGQKTLARASVVKGSFCFPWPNSISGYDD